MRTLLQNLWHDDAGALIASEYLFIGTILVLGTIVGLSGLREAVNVELTELGNALLALSQGYSISGASTGNASTDGSQAIDTTSTLATVTTNPPSSPSVIDVPVY